MSALPRLSDVNLRGTLYRERLDTFHKLLLGIILHGRMGRPWDCGAIACAGVV